MLHALSNFSGFSLQRKHFVSSNRPIAYRMLAFVRLCIFLGFIMAATDPSSASRQQQYQGAKRPLPTNWEGDPDALANDILRTPGMEKVIAELDDLRKVYPEHPAIGGLDSFVHVGTCCSKGSFAKFKAPNDNPKNRSIVCFGNFPPIGADNSYASSPCGKQF